MSHRISSSRLLILALCFALWCTGLGGCTSVKRTFPGHNRNEVWAAMLAAAHTPAERSVAPSPPSSPSPPSPGGWVVRQNEVWSDEQAGRIEIFRRLERKLPTQGAVERLNEENRTLKFAVELQPEEKKARRAAAPPEVRLVSRSVTIPAHVWEEAERYFDEVRQVLEVKAGEEPPPDANNESPATKPDVGLDDAAR